MKSVYIYPLILFFTQFSYLHAQTVGEEYGDPLVINGSDEIDDSDEQGPTDWQVIKKYFPKTIAKLGLYSGQVASPSLVVKLAKKQGITGQAAIMAIKNPSWKNVKDGIVEQLLPDYSKQGTPLETIYDKELMRDIDQYVMYAETFMTYGLNMNSYDTEVRNHMSPEKGVTEFVENPEEKLEEEKFGDMTVSEYQNQVTKAYQAVSEYEYTGDDEADELAVQQIIGNYFESEQDRSNVLFLMGELSSAEYDEDDEEGNEELVSEIFTGFFEMLEAQKEEALAVEEALADETGAGADQGWDNTLNGLMADLGAEDRDVGERYGAYAEPYYTEEKTKFQERNEQAQVELTNIIKTWKTLELARYADMLNEMIQIGQELIENGISYDTSDLKTIVGELEKIWKAIKNYKSTQ